MHMLKNVSQFKHPSRTLIRRKETLFVYIVVIPLLSVASGRYALLPKTCNYIPYVCIIFTEEF